MADSENFGGTTVTELAKKYSLDEFTLYDLLSSPLGSLPETKPVFVRRIFPAIRRLAAELLFLAALVIKKVSFLLR